MSSTISPTICPNHLRPTLIDSLERQVESIERIVAGIEVESLRPSYRARLKWIVGALTRLEEKLGDGGAANTSVGESSIAATGVAALHDDIQEDQSASEWSAERVVASVYQKVGEVIEQAGKLQVRSLRSIPCEHIDEFMRSALSDVDAEVTLEDDLASFQRRVALRTGNRYKVVKNACYAASEIDTASPFPKTRFATIG